MLVLLLFLKRLAEYIHHHDHWSGILVTDSKSIIDTVRGTNTLRIGHDDSKMYRRQLGPLSPEWDVVFGIQALLHEMPGLKIQHILEGHQDRECDFHCLPLLAQLNVEVDTLANQYQCDYGSNQPNVLPTKRAGAHLVLPKGTVTSHYEAAICYHASAEPLKAHLREHNKWPLDVFETINWRAHGKFIRKHIDKRTHLIKLVHGILPTNANLHRIVPIRNKCPSCRAQREDWTHIIRCRTPQRNARRHEMIHIIDVKCE